MEYREKQTEGGVANLAKGIKTFASKSSICHDGYFTGINIDTDIYLFNPIRKIASIFCTTALVARKPFVYKQAKTSYSYAY
jgi:hypothetical protein